MRILNILVPLVLFVIGVGCQCDEARTVSTQVVTQQVTQTTTPQPAAPVATVPSELKPTSIQQVVTDKATYTIEVLPNPSPRLTPTSREGDKADRVYSSNIIAVYVRTNSGVTVDSTNAPVVPVPEKQTEP